MLFADLLTLHLVTFLMFFYSCSMLQVTFAKPIHLTQEILASVPNPLYAQLCVLGGETGNEDLLLVSPLTLERAEILDLLLPV